MIEKVLSDNLIKVALNQALKLDPQAAEKLAPLNGKTIAIKLNFREQPWVFIIVEQQLEVDTVAMQDCDVKLSGSLGGFLQLFADQENDHDTGEKLYIEGDLHTAQQFQRVMKTLSPDFAYALEKRFGTRLGGILHEGLQRFKFNGEQARDKLSDTLRQYFNGEAGACLTRVDFAAHQARLSDLCQRLARLEASANQLGQ